MLNQSLVAFAAFGYLCVFFAIAYYGDRRRAQGKSIIANPYIYTLSLAVYCTSWTFYGSVGRAATQGLTFLTIYLGPTIMVFFWWFVLRKIVRICKENNLTTMSDFLTLRYGKRPFLGALTTVGVVLAIVPYIGLQLKSVSDTFNILAHRAVVSPLTTPVFHDTTFYIALILAVFCIFFGARHLDPTERHEGMVAAIAFESVVKLLSFLAIGILVTYGLFHGLGDIFHGIHQRPEFRELLQLNTSPENSYMLFLVQTLLAMGAITFLPRQFHMAVVENTDERHILTAMWLLPLYLLLINIFVMPIACGGLLLGLPPAQGDTFVLQIPLQNGHQYLALLAFLGGMSASTAMVAVATVAVSTMLLNSLVMPGAIRLRLEKYLPAFLMNIKRTAIVLVILLGYGSYRLIGPSAMLVDMGLIAFFGVMQLVPAILGALYWRDATRHGAIAGIGLGFLFWAYTLVLPYMIRAGWFSTSILEEGPFGLAWLNPTAFLGLNGLDNLTHAFFWAMLFNVGAFVTVSLLTPHSSEEEEQAYRFTQVFELEEERPRNKRFTFIPNLEQFKKFMVKFIGTRKAEDACQTFLREVEIPEREWGDREKLRLVYFVERTIGGSIGPAAARVIVEGYLSSLGSRMEGFFDLFSRVSSSLEESQEKLKRRVAELSVLYEAARRLAVSLYIPDLLEGLLEVLVEKLGVEKSAVRLLDQDGFLHLKGLRGLPPEARDIVIKPDPESLLGECVLTRQVISVQDSSTVGDRLDGLLKEETMASLVLAPITTESLTLGVLTAASSKKGYFAKEHVEFFQSLAGQLGLAVRSTNIEEALRLDESRLEAIWKLSQMTKATLQQITDFALEEGVRLTKSKIGYLAFMNEDETVLIMHSMSTVALQECAIIDKPIIYPVETTGLWGEAVRQRRPVITNNYADSSPYKKGYPEGHVEIKRHMNIPVFDGDRIVAVAGVGNKEEEYDESDVRQLTLLMNAMWWHIKRQREEQALTDEVEHMHLFQSKMIQTSNEGIIAHDPIGTIIIFNEGAERIFGYRKEEVIGMIPIQDLFPPGAAGEIKERISSPDAGGIGRLMQYETVGISKTGESIPIELSASQIFEHDQETATVIFFRDLRERKQMQENLLRSERLVAIGQAAAHITHEIKNPLMLIGGFARRVMKDITKNPQKNSERLQIIIDEVKRLEDFLIEVGSYAKLSEPHTIAGDLNTMIKELCSRLEPSLRESGIRLVLDLDPNLPYIKFDPLHLRQVILNIAKNGIEAMGEGGTLTLSTGQKPDGVVLQISDTGDGIPADVLDKIFQPFYSTKPKGSGLGLTIAQKIIEAHKGKITIESEIHEGTRFTIFFENR